VYQRYTLDGILASRAAASTPEKARSKLKSEKSAAKPRKKRRGHDDARLSLFSWTRYGYREEAVGAAADDQVTHVLPSLGAKYRGLWKTCQGLIGDKPQNLWVQVS